MSDEAGPAFDRSTASGLAGLARPSVTADDAAAIAADSYGIDARVEELGSNQDRNFLLTEADGGKSVLRIDNEVFPDEARDAQHAALEAFRGAGIDCPAVLPGADGALVQRWRGLAVRRSEFARGEPLVDAGYFAPTVLEEFGRLAAASVRSLATLQHPGPDRAHMWDMRVAHIQVDALQPAIGDASLRARVAACAAKAAEALAPLREALPVQAIHGDLTDDNVYGSRGSDSRLHPESVLDLGALSYGWRVAELAVCATSMVHHEPLRPWRVLHTIAAFHDSEALAEAEARALWPLIHLRAALLVASGWRQTAMESDNAYAHDRIALEQTIFEAVDTLDVTVGTAMVLDATGFGNALPRPALAAPETVSPPFRALLPDIDGDVAVLDPGVVSPALDEGAWLETGVEQRLAAHAFEQGAAAAVFPYGVFRLTRAAVNADEASATWPIETEVRLAGGVGSSVVAPCAGEIVETGQGGTVTLRRDDGWSLTITGLRPAGVAGGVQKGDRIGVVHSDTSTALLIGLHRSDVSIPARNDPGAALATPGLVGAWSLLSHDPAALLGLPPLAERDRAAEEQQRRTNIVASASERYYRQPPQIERGWRHYLADTTGRSYVDMVNNVAGLGHSHPSVARAASEQLRLLGTNSRFLYSDLAEYSERLLALLPTGDFDTVMLVNSGSEAVDLSLRLAQAATGRRTIVAMREAYHGWTMASDAVTTSAYDNPDALGTRPGWVHVTDVPNVYRGNHRGDSATDAYLSELDDELARLVAGGTPPAAFICESILGNAGGVLLPDGYLAGVYDRIRAAGGLAIADEIQVGFGRTGAHFWGFERSGVVPDIVAIAKPMGNGFPIGGVITSRGIADALESQGQFFSSTGGNPVSCRVGLAVLDTMEAEGLQKNAADVGEVLRENIRALQARHPIIGAVHGEGLYLGIELVRDRETLEPAAAEAAAICERLREIGIIMLTTSERSNVLKVKPPLCLTRESADFVIRGLDRVLSEGW